MRADSPEIVALDEVPTSEILALLRTCLGPGAVERDEAFWRWKHEDSPFGRSPGLVAMAGDRPVALRVFLRWRFSAAGRSVEAVRAVDTVTHPAWRRQGLFRRLTLQLVEQAHLEGAAFVFNTPNPRSRAGYLAMGWEDVGRAPLLVRLRRPIRALKGLLPRTDSGHAGSTAAPEGLQPIGDLLDEPALAGFLDAWGAGDRRLRTPRTREYLRWRYRDTPGVTYGVEYHLQGTSGAIVVGRSRRRRGLRELTLSEVLASEDRTGREVGRDLIERVCHLPGPDYVAAVASPIGVECDLLRRAGWRPVPLGPRLVASPLGRNEMDPCDRNSWRLSIGDLELF